MDPEYEAIVLFTSTIKGVQTKWMSIDRRIPPSTILFTNIVSTIVNYTDTDLLQHELLLVQFTFCNGYLNYSVVTNALETFECLSVQHFALLSGTLT